MDQVQDALGQQILIEKPSTYIAFEAARWPKPSSCAGLRGRTGCALLLDVNNVYVSAQNHGFDAEAYLRAFPTGAVREIHLAGYFEAEDSAGEPFLIDAHDSPVRDAVWALYARAIQRTGAAPTLIEWDNGDPGARHACRAGGESRCGGGGGKRQAGTLAFAQEGLADAASN